MMKLILSKGIYDSDTRSINHDGVVIDGNKIIETGKAEDLKTRYRCGEILDYSNCYGFPGLVNTHVHLEFVPAVNSRERYVTEEPYTNYLRAALAANVMLNSGVTTLRDAGSTWRILSLNTAGARELLPLPRMQLAGVPLTVTGGHMNFCGEEVDSKDEILKSIRKHQKMGAACIKIVASGGQMTPGSLPERDSYEEEIIKAMAEESRRLNLPTFSHCLTTSSYVNSMRAGVDCIEHCACFVRNKKNGLLERVYENEVMEEFRGDGRFFMNAISNNYHQLDACRAGEREPDEREVFLLEQEERECGIFRKLVELGMEPVVGTDAGCGLTYFDETWMELEIMVKRCGYSIKDTIHAATYSGAKALGYGEWLGKIKKDYQADMIFMHKNPLEDIHAYQNVEHVLCDGITVR